MLGFDLTPSDIQHVIHHLPGCLGSQQICYLFTLTIDLFKTLKPLHKGHMLTNFQEDIKKKRKAGIHVKLISCAGV